MSKEKMYQVVGYSDKGNPIMMEVKEPKEKVSAKEKIKKLNLKEKAKTAGKYIMVGVGGALAGGGAVLLHMANKQAASGISENATTIDPVAAPDPGYGRYPIESEPESEAETETNPDVQVYQF